MFDLPVETSLNRKNYRRFLKYIKSQGFVMLQKSVYTKFHVNRANLNREKTMILTHAPIDGFVSLLSITENQFQSIEHVIGSPEKKVINDSSRYIEL